MIKGEEKTCLGLLFSENLRRSLMSHQGVIDRSKRSSAYGEGLPLSQQYPRVMSVPDEFGLLSVPDIAICMAPWQLLGNQYAGSYDELAMFVEATLGWISATPMNGVSRKVQEKRGPS